MNIAEYEKVKNMGYREYCDYLKKKYGASKYDYFSPSYVKNAKVTRTKEGLICHHIFEDTAILLAEIDHAKANPFSYQKAENLCYCDYLEHLFLHILIVENPAKNQNKNEAVGMGGVINFLVPELNDLYSGWITAQAWRKTCHDKVINDEDVYFELLKRFNADLDGTAILTGMLFTSFNEKFGGWSKQKNQELYNKMKYLLG